jgi:Tol biopolymer transport system component
LFVPEEIELIKRITKILLILSLMILAGCSIDLSGPTHKPPEPTYIMDTPVAGETTVSPTAPDFAATPLPWAGSHLSGHLFYIKIPRQVIELDLASGQRTILFSAPNNAFVSSALVSPDGKWIVMAYAPPADPNLQSASTDLYVMPADGSTPPQVLLKRTTPKEDFFNPVWSADGKYVYYSHLMQDINGTNKYTNFTYDLERVAFPAGQPQKLIDSAFWPRLSPDGSKMTYVSFVPSTNSNDAYIADPDGSHSKLVMPAGAFTAVDAPLFSPDGKTIVFSAVGEPQLPSLSWLDQLLGVQIAEAHNVPSDWWRVSVDGGKPERLTQVNGTGMYADFAPDGKHIAFASITGLFVMQPDGSNLIQLSNEGIGGSVSWTP